MPKLEANTLLVVSTLLLGLCLYRSTRSQPMAGLPVGKLRAKVRVGAGGDGSHALGFVVSQAGTKSHVWALLCPQLAKPCDPAGAQRRRG